MSEKELEQYLKESGIDYNKKSIEMLDNGYYAVESNNYTLYIDSNMDTSNVTIWSFTPGDGHGGNDYIQKEAMSQNPPASIIAVDKNWNEKSSQSSLVAAVRFAGNNGMEISGMAHDCFSHGASNAFKVSNRALKEYSEIYGHRFKDNYAMTIIDPAGCGPTEFVDKEGNPKYPYLEDDNIKMAVVMGGKNSQKYAFSQESWKRIHGYYGGKAKRIYTPILRHGAIANSCIRNHFGPWMAGFSELLDRSVTDGSRGKVKPGFKIKVDGEWTDLRKTSFYQTIERLRLSSHKRFSPTSSNLTLHSDGVVSNDYLFVNDCMNNIMTQISREDFSLEGVTFDDPTGLSEIINNCIAKYYNVSHELDGLLAQQTTAVNSYTQEMVDLDNSLAKVADNNNFSNSDYTSTKKLY